MSTVLRAPQTAEQLVEVLTEPAYALAVIAVQAIGLSAATELAKQIVDNPVPQVRRRGGGGLQGFRAGQGTPAGDMEQIVEFPARGGLQGCLPGQSSSSSTCLLENTDDVIQGVFALFPEGKNVAGLGPHSGSETIHAERSSNAS